MFQHHPKDLNMILNEPKYYPIIKVDFRKFVNKVFKGNDHYFGKNSKSILESKGHYRVLEKPPLCHKGGVVSIFLCDSNLLVTRVLYMIIHLIT